MNSRYTRVSKGSVNRRTELPNLTSLKEQSLSLEQTIKEKSDKAIELQVMIDALNLALKSSRFVIDGLEGTIKAYTLSDREIPIDVAHAANVLSAFLTDKREAWAATFNQTIVHHSLVRNELAFLTRQWDGIRTMINKMEDEAENA